MLTIMEQSTETCLGIKVSGKLKAEDYDKVEPLLSNAIKAHGTVNLVIHIEDFEGYGDTDALRKDLQMAFNEYKDVAKVAIVGTEDWQEWFAKIIDPLTLGTDERFFQPDQTDEAWTWACGVDWKA
ncbi:MAG: STAS/SEC14 domain-containing protein [Anaerolineae bacterium]